MDNTSAAFPANARRALNDERLQSALAGLATGFPERRREAVARLPEFDALRDAAREIKDHTLAHLDAYLALFEESVAARGGTVHWCRDAAEARDVIGTICQDAGARTVTKSKSMITEEIGVNDHLESLGIQPVETDLGEYIIQLRREPPSHIIAPAIHLTKEDVAETFRAAHRGFDPARPLDRPTDMLIEARSVLRGRFLAADVGITGANFLIAETGTAVVVTNEGNADLTMTLPRVHIVCASLEKVVPTLEDATALLRVLARSATGQEQSVYTTFATGPKRERDADGPDAFHVVLLDNGRTELLAGEFRDILRCIRCGACLNHCPVYGAVGGHAYGWVYSGPMGAVLTPSLTDLATARNLPQASSLCGRCEEICPVRIPLPAMLRRLRERAAEARLGPAGPRLGLKAWAWFAARPRAYRVLTALVALVLGRARGGAFRRLPFAGGWTASRDLPAPAPRTFHSQWKAGRSK